MLSGRWEVIVMGSGQDAGVSQVGCSCKQCTAARSDPAARRLAPSLLVKNDAMGQAIIIDASPDIREQLDRYLAPLPLRAVRAIFITHGHVGHYWGLALLGKEGPDLKDVAVHGTGDVVKMLRDTPALALMESRGNIRMQAISSVGDGRSCDDGQSAGVIFGDLSIEAFTVPHRQELTQTVGFRICGPSESVVYIPDIDRWTAEALAEIRSADFALIDGTFFSAEELGGMRAMQEIPHPPIVESLEALGNLEGLDRTGVYFSHLNHTNTAGLGGPERDQILRAGLGIAFDGMRIQI